MNNTKTVKKKYKYIIKILKIKNIIIQLDFQKEYQKEIFNKTKESDELIQVINLNLFNLVVIGR